MEKKLKAKRAYGYAVMATNSSPYSIGGQFAIFRLRRDAEAWRDETFGEDYPRKEIRNVLIMVSIL